MTEHPLETARIRAVYEQRDSDNREALYRWFEPTSQLFSFRRGLIISKILSQHGLSDLSNIEVVDVGCGSGTWLRQLLQWGAEPGKLHGVDLLAANIERGQRLSPHLDLRLTEGWPLPFQESGYDLTSAFTVFSSITDPAARTDLASEIYRILKPGGLAIIYDVKLKNPFNRDLVPIGKAEIRRLFPGCKIERRTLNLIPPLARRLVPYCLGCAVLLEAVLPFLRSHAIYIIHMSPQRRG